MRGFFITRLYIIYNVKKVDLKRTIHSARDTGYLPDDGLYDANGTPARLSLYELNNLVAETLSIAMPGEYWVEAELSEAREVRGHCFMELVEKDSRSNTPIARASAKCWQSRWALIKPMFERVTGQRLHAGMKVLLRVHANFHEAYGFSWIVNDINPEYTMGDLARRRQEIIAQLRAEGVFDLQHELQLPMFTQRVAVISSEGAAGYGDFCRQLADNAAGYAFSVTLFQATMQGEGVEESVIAALDAIYAEAQNYDVVVIIRGGGATSDLSGFDTLALAENVANFPLPIITGIGHDRDQSVLDMVANTSVKTPTAAAALLIDRLAEIDRRITQAQTAMAHTVEAIVTGNRARLEHMESKVPMLATMRLTAEAARIDRLAVQLAQAAKQRLADGNMQLQRAADAMRAATQRRMVAERHRLDMLEQRAAAADPDRLLAKGYSITLCNGKAVHDPKLLAPGCEITTLVEKGKITSTVKLTTKKRHTPWQKK